MIFNYKYKWQSQFFDQINQTKTNLTIPLSDSEAYSLYPEYNWVYNKLQLMSKIGYSSAPHGVYPSELDYPVISRPITNLTGMGAGISFANSNDELDLQYTPGHFWTKQFFGDHISVDLVLNKGNVVWYCATEGIPDPERVGAFSSWNILDNFVISQYILDFFKEHFRSFRGIVNIELIGNHLIEMHLRMSSQWVDLNGEHWLTDLVDFYSEGSLGIQRNKPKGYSVPLFLDKYPESNIRSGVLNKIIHDFDLSSIQITYDIDKQRTRNSMPPGGVRVAVLNSNDFKSCEKAKFSLKEIFDNS